MTNHVKQVLVWRADLRNAKTGQKVRSGKMAAQLAHASMKVFLDCMDRTYSQDGDTYSLTVQHGGPTGQWLDGAFTKVCCSVPDEQQLLALLTDAQKADIPCALITDNGLTEFNGVKTNTCIAIGPDYASRIDAITGHLPLL